MATLSRQTITSPAWIVNRKILILRNLLVMTGHQDSARNGAQSPQFRQVINLQDSWSWLGHDQVPFRAISARVTNHGNRSEEHTSELQSLPTRPSSDLCAESSVSTGHKLTRFLVMAWS